MDFPLFWESERGRVPQRKASSRPSGGIRRAGCVPGGNALAFALCGDIYTVMEVLAPSLLPTSQAATANALGHTEGSLLTLKGPCVSLPAGPALLPAAKRHSLHSSGCPATRHSGNTRAAPCRERPGPPTAPWRCSPGPRPVTKVMTPLSVPLWVF